jgi:hypothetical protein
MLPGMEKNRQGTKQGGGFDAQIGALLDRIHDHASVVDRLMAMPLPGGSSEAPEWDAAVTRRLEIRLAEAMRAVIENEPERKRA